MISNYSSPDLSAVAYPPDITLGQGLDLFLHHRAIPHFKSWKQYKNDFNAFPPHLRLTPIAHLEHNVVRDYLLAVGSALNHSNAHRKFKFLKSALTWLWHNGYIATNPIAQLRSPYPTADKGVRERILTHTELGKIMGSCRAMGYPWGMCYLTLIYTGQRLSEVARMQWNELDLQGGVWTIPAHRTKNKQEHQVPLCPAMVNLLLHIRQSYNRRHHGAYVFSTQNGHTPLQCFRTAQHKIMQYSGVTNWVNHTLRHTTITNLVRQGVNIIVVAKIANHSTKQFQGITGRYNKYNYITERTTALHRYGEWLARL